MSLHVHATLEAWSKKKEVRYALSYLNSSDLQLHFEQGVTRSIYPEDCPMLLKQLIELHGWEIKHHEPEPLAPDVAQKIMETVGVLSEIKGWRTWCDRNLRTWPGKNRWLKETWPAFKADFGDSHPLVAWASGQPADGCA